MSKLFKWLGIGICVVLVLALLAAGTIYLLIGADLARQFENEGKAVAIPDDPASIAAGQRLARLRGCYGGCHGETVNGSVFLEAPDGTRIVAPDLARVARSYSDAELENAIRHGIRPDGTSLIRIMPSEMLYHLSDEDLGAIIAFLRTQQPGDDEVISSRPGLLGRLMFFYYRSAFDTILAAATVDHDARRLSPAPGDPIRHGRYLAVTTCTECHGADLRGVPGIPTPTLAIVAAYAAEDFAKLMRTGVPIGDRQLGLMARVSRTRFAHFDDNEIEALHAYLGTLAASAPGN